MGKLISLRELKKLNFKGKRVVLVGGTFDVLTIGHIKFLQKCREFGNILIAGVSSDKNVKKRKGNMRPINPQNQRGFVLAALEMVDYAFISSLSAYNDRNLRLIKPDVVVMPLEKGKFAGRRMYKERVESSFKDIQVELVYSPSKFHSTTLIEKILRTT